MDAGVLACQFTVGDFVLTRNLDGVTHDESLRPPSPAGNPLNWMVGHVARARNQALGLLGQPTLFADTDFDAYGPRFDAARALPLDELARRFEKLGTALAEALAAASPSQMATPAPFSPTGNPDETIGSLVASIAFHEAYHLGQTGLSRRLLGKPGALLAPGEAGHA